MFSFGKGGRTRQLKITGEKSSRRVLGGSKAISKSLVTYGTQIIELGRKRLLQILRIPQAKESKGFSQGNKKSLWRPVEHKINV